MQVLKFINRDDSLLWIITNWRTNSQSSQGWLLANICTFTKSLLKYRNFYKLKKRCSKFTVKCIYDCLFWHDTGPVKFTTNFHRLFHRWISCRSNQWIRTCLKCLKSDPKPQPFFDVPQPESTFLFDPKP